MKVIKWIKGLFPISKRIKIVDVIYHKNKYYTQVFYVLNRAPAFEYEYQGNWLKAEDNGLWSFYEQRPHDRDWKAFAGRKLTLKMKGGGAIIGDGDIWDAVPPEYSKFIFQSGYGTIESLGKCNVFSSFYYDKTFRELINKWLKNRKPSNNYYKYDRKDKRYMQHRIISRWEE